jgi:hypothetical protein
LVVVDPVEPQVEIREVQDRIILVELVEMEQAAVEVAEMEDFSLGKMGIFPCLPEEEVAAVDLVLLEMQDHQEQQIREMQEVPQMYLIHLR